MWGQAPIRERKDTDEGVREEARLEKWFGGVDQVSEGESGWDSIRASRREEVFGEEPELDSQRLFRFVIWGVISKYVVPSKGSAQLVHHLHKQHHKGLVLKLLWRIFVIFAEATFYRTDMYVVSTMMKTFGTAW